MSFTQAICVTGIALVSGWLVWIQAAVGRRWPSCAASAYYLFIAALALASLVFHVRGFGQYGAVVEMAAGFAVFAAALCAWPSRLVVWASLGLITVIAGAGLYEVCRGAAPLAGLMNVNHFGCFIAVALPVVLGMALHSARWRRRVQAGMLALLVVLLLFLLVASKCRMVVAGGGLTFHCGCAIL